MSTQRDITSADGWFVGEDKSLVFTITSGGGAQNITGWTIQFALGDVLSGTADVTKTASLTTPAAGICTVTIDSADTVGLDASATWYYRLRRTNAGSRAELAYGSVDLLDVYVN